MSVNTSNRLCTKQLRYMDWILDREQISLYSPKRPCAQTFCCLGIGGFLIGVLWRRLKVNIHLHPVWRSTLQLYLLFLYHMPLVALLNQVHIYACLYIGVKLRFTQSLLRYIKLSFDKRKKIVFSSTCLTFWHRSFTFKF